MKSREEKPKHEEKLKDDRSELGEKETGEEEEKVKETLPASWLKPIKWFMGQFVKDSGKYSPRGLLHSRKHHVYLSVDVVQSGVCWKSTISNV